MGFFNFLCINLLLPLDFKPGKTSGPGEKDLVGTIIVPKAKGQGLSWAGHLSGSGDLRARGRLKGQYFGLHIKTGAVAPLTGGLGRVMEEKPQVLRLDYWYMGVANRMQGWGCRKMPPLALLEDLRKGDDESRPPTQGHSSEQIDSDPPCLLRFRTMGFLTAEGMRYMIRFSFVRKQFIKQTWVWRRA